MRNDDPASSNPADGRRPERTSRPALTVGAFLCGLLVALLAVHFLSHAPAGSAGLSADSAHPAMAVTGRDRVGAATARPVANSTGNAAAVPQPAETEICGMPGIAANPALSIEDDPRFAARIDAAERHFIDVLSMNSDERVRAAGLLVERQEDRRLAYRRQAADVEALCGADSDCAKGAGAGWMSAVALQSMLPATDALARMAATSENPAVYAAAIEACPSALSSLAPACQFISAAQWARIDPDNADAWLHVAEEARGRRDDAALDDAMNHVAHAKGSRTYGGLLASLADAAVPVGSDDFDAAQMHGASLRLSAEWMMEPLQTASQYCGQPLLADSNRQQTCEAIAHQLLDNGSTLVARSVGVGIGRRLGWPTDSITALRQELQAIQRAWITSWGDDNDTTSCRAVASWQKRIQQIGQLGEASAARAALLASGRSVADLAANVEVERAAAAAANEPASGASQAPASSTP